MGKNRQQVRSAAPATNAISSEEGKDLATSETTAEDQTLSAEQQQEGNEPGDQADQSEAASEAAAATGATTEAPPVSLGEINGLLGSEVPVLDSAPAPETFLGSNVQPARVLVGGEEVALGYAVSQAFQASGLSVAEWNGLEQDDREVRIAAAIDPVETPAPALVSQGVQDQAAAAPAPAQVEQAKVEQLQAAQAAEAVVAAKPVVPEDIKALVDGASILGKAQLETLLAYMVAMAPRKPITEVDGARYQVQLYRLLTTVINRLEDDFTPVFTAILRMFDEHSNGVFKETSVFRFIPQLTLAEPDRRQFLALLNMLKVLAPVKGRQIAIKQVDMTRTLGGKAISEVGRQRVLAYFGL